MLPSEAKGIFEPRHWVSQLSALRGRVRTRRKVSWKNSQMEEHFDLLVNVPFKYMVIYRDEQNPATGCLGTVWLSVSFSSPVFSYKKHTHTTSVSKTTTTPLLDQTATIKIKSCCSA